MLAAIKDIIIHTEIAADISSMHCDGERVLQVLGNLLGNAVKFTPEGGRITVRTVSLGAFVRIEVSDTGPGIKREHVDAIFQRHWAGRLTGAGAGLGLYIAQGIVRAHGGRLWVHSEPGHGASFFATFPAGPAARPCRRQDAQSFRLS